MTQNATFFTYVTSRAVVCVTEGEVGHPQVEEVVARITSWQVAALERHMKVTLLAVGMVTLQESGLAVHRAAQPSPSTSHVHVTADYMWSVFSVDRVALGVGPPVHVYAALNVGREGWCVLTADFHTLLHVLHHNGMEAPHLTGQEEAACGPACEGRRHGLVPRARAGLRHYPSFRRPRCVPVRPVTVVTQRQQPREGQVQQHLYIRMTQTLAITLERGVEESPLHTFLRSLTVYYYSNQDSEAGWMLVAGFDVRQRKHRAVGRTGVGKQQVEVVCEEGDERSFLTGVGPLVRCCGEVSRNTFLRHFTQINPLSWEEAAAAVDGEGGLRASAFRQVCGLPLPYLHQHAPRALYFTVFMSRALVSWTAEKDLKTLQDIL